MNVCRKVRKIVHQGLINQGHGNTAARTVQVYKNDKLNENALLNIFKEVIKNNRAINCEIFGNHSLIIAPVGCLLLLIFYWPSKDILTQFEC